MTLPGRGLFQYMRDTKPHGKGLMPSAPEQVLQAVLHLLH